MADNLKSYSFTVTGKIRGKSRPRFNTKTGRAFKVKNDRIFEDMVKTAYNSSEAVRFNDNDYIKMDLDMYFAIPKSYSKKRRALCISGEERPAKKPDLDNILKNVADSLNDLAFKDDIQILETTCRKFYTDKDTDYIVIKLEEVK